MSDLTMRLQAQLANNPLAVRWHALPPRDRLALGLLGGFLLLVLLYLLLWRPVSQNLEQARGFLQQQRALHAYLQEHAPQVRALQGKPQVSIDTAALQGLITGSAAGQGLNIERLDNQVKLETKKHEAGETLLIRNDLYAPVEIELRLEQVQNAIGAPGKPIR